MDRFESTWVVGAWRKDLVDLDALSGLLAVMVGYCVGRLLRRGKHRATRANRPDDNRLRKPAKARRGRARQPRFCESVIPTDSRGRTDQRPPDVKVPPGKLIRGKDDELREETLQDVFVALLGLPKAYRAQTYTSELWSIVWRIAERNLRRRARDVDFLPADDTRIVFDQYGLDDIWYSADQALIARVATRWIEDSFAEDLDIGQVICHCGKRDKHRLGRRLENNRRCRAVLGYLTDGLLPSVREIAGELGVPKTTAHRLLSDVLCAVGARSEHTESPQWERSPQWETRRAPAPAPLFPDDNSSPVSRDGVLAPYNGRIHYTWPWDKSSIGERPERKAPAPIVD